MCLRYLLTLHQNWSSQYQIQIKRTGDINNVQTFEVLALYGNYQNISFSILLQKKQKQQIDVYISKKLDVVSNNWN